MFSGRVNFPDSCAPAGFPGTLSLIPLDDRRCMLRACSAPSPSLPARTASAVLCGLPHVEHCRAARSMRCAQFSFEFDTVYEPVSYTHLTLPTTPYV